MNLDTLLIAADYSPTQITLGLLIAFALGFIWATIYRKTHTGIAYTRAFYLSLILIPPIIAMIMMAIGSNVALSLGLVGSLSVIRFCDRIGNLLPVQVRSSAATGHPRIAHPSPRQCDGHWGSPR